MRARHGMALAMAQNARLPLLHHTYVHVTAVHSGQALYCHYASGCSSSDPGQPRACARVKRHERGAACGAGGSMQRQHEGLQPGAPRCDVRLLLLLAGAGVPEGRPRAARLPPGPHL